MLYVHVQQLYLSSEYPPNQYFIKDFQSKQRHSKDLKHTGYSMKKNIFETFNNYPNKKS